MFKRNDRGQMVVTIEETEGTLGMTITDGATYRFKRHEYRATLEEGSSDTLACFQSLPCQDDDEPSLFLDRNDGCITDDTGTVIGDYNELEQTA